MFVNNISIDKSSMMQVAHLNKVNNNAGNEEGVAGSKNGIEPFIIDISQQGKDMVSEEMRNKIRALEKGDKVQSSNIVVQTIADGLGNVQGELENMRSLANKAGEDVTDEDRLTIQEEMEKIKQEIPKHLNKLKSDLFDALPDDRIEEFQAYLAKQQDPTTNVVSATEKFEKNLQDHLQEVYAIDVSSKQGVAAALDAIDGAVGKIVKIREELGYDKDGNFIKANDKALYGDSATAESKIAKAIRAIFDRHHTIAA